MKKHFIRNILLISGLLLGFGLVTSVDIYAEETEDNSSDATPAEANNGTSISITPVSNILQIASNSKYDNKFTVSNTGSDEMKIEVYSAPYSYVHSEEDDSYKLGFNRENNFTQITRWITFKDIDGEYVERANYTIPANQSIDVEYKITTPDNIPAGGQYAVIFAHTLTSTVSVNGIKTEASPGLVIYGRSSEGTIDISPVISDMKIEQSITEGNTTRNNFYASAKVKNNGNVDFNAFGKMKVESIIGFSSYETPNDKGRISIIPETELTISDEWEESPNFGIYRVTWTVSVGETNETIEKTIFLIPPIVILITIIVLTFLIVWIIIRVRKRKERRSRLAI